MFCFTSDFSAFSWHFYSYSKNAALKVLVVRLWWVAFQIPPLCFCFRAAPHAEPWRRGKQLLTRAFSKLVVNIPGGTLTVAPFTIHNCIIISCIDSTSQGYKDMTASPICSLALIYTIFKQLHFSLYSYFLLTSIAWCNFDSTRCLIESYLIRFLHPNKAFQFANMQLSSVFLALATIVSVTQAASRTCWQRKGLERLQ